MARAGINGYGYNEYGQYGYYDPHEGWVAAPGGMLAYMSGLTPQSQQEAQDWANNGFNPQAYLAANPDVANDPYYRSRPWEHYYTHGAREGRSPGGAAPAPAPAAAPAAAPAGPAAVNPNSPDAIRQAQLELVQQQRDIATQMQQRQQALQDQLMAAQGYEPDGAGGYRLNATAQAAADQQNQIAAQLRQRTLDALAGNLPVDPALERGLGEQRRTLEATLRGNLGT
ncbi:MAG TPA: hypothetical protein VFT99_22615, partial [Roseiflexaceae bacterium]|nr:hypothetical protein [Roseiflexaceae bacterium]